MKNSSMKISMKKGSNTPKPFQRLYAKTELRPFDVMVTWQVVSGKTQADAFRVASYIAKQRWQAPKSMKATNSVKKAMKKDTDWAAKFRQWKVQLKAQRGWEWTKLLGKVKQLKQAGVKYEDVKTKLGVVTRK